MVNDSVSARKTKDIDVSSSTKSGKNDSSASVSVSDGSGLRRSTRCQNNSSPVSVRKSHRLEKLTSPATPPSKKKAAGDPSPLRRSVRDKKSQSPSAKAVAEKRSPANKSSKQQSKVLGELDSSKEKVEKQDKTLKEIAQEMKEKASQNGSSEVGAKRKMRLDARSYRDMFKLLKKSIVSESESDKKNRLENCDDDNGDSDPEKADEGEQEHSDGEELKEDCEKDIDGDAGDSYPCEIEDGEGLLVSTGNGNGSGFSQMGKLSDDGNGSGCSQKDKLSDGGNSSGCSQKDGNGSGHGQKDKLSDDGNGPGCSQKGINLGASAVGIEVTGKGLTDVASSVYSSCKMSIFAEECSKCLRKQRLARDAPELELCCCLLSTINDMDDTKDREQFGTIITAEFAEELRRGVKQNDPLLDVQPSTCVICKCAGKLLHCLGKRCGKNYHPQCSLNPEPTVYLPNWYCSDCTKKRCYLGVHSVSQGIESIFDVREVDMSNTEGRQKQKQCFVKYKGLAHIHNRWVPELQLIHEAPEFCAKPDKQKEWNPDWVVPHRLLQRRSVIIDDKPIEQELNLESNSQREWLVKWCGLDYDQLTWESEDSSFLKKPEAQRMIEEYETRHNMARKTPLSGSNESLEKRKDLLVKLKRSDSCCQNFVNKVREQYHKGRNAVLLDEQDRFMKVIHLVSSLVAHVCRPFLIITPYESLLSWEAEFKHIAASINVVVYGGNSDARNVIRCLEFYGKGGQVMLQVLLSSAEVIAEDVEELKGIEWEAVIIDDCQQSCILTHSARIAILATGWRLLLLNAQLKDNTTDYVSILSLLKPGGSINQNFGLLADSNEDINVLKNELSSYIICATFLEYWVPVEISNIQLELYCNSILSNSSSLNSYLKSDPVGSLQNLLISLRKCCCHPYIVDWNKHQSSLRMLYNDLSSDALMEVDVKASGKLYFLDKLLPELKNQKLKVLILFQQSCGSGRDTTSFVLEDLLRTRFGPESYEYVESGLIPSKKQAACNKFNSLSKRSFFLLETPACSPIIKLSSVDAVIIFDSDWNPHNDLKALQRITIDSKLEQIKVFRLYCPCTVEEKVLIFAKNNIDCTLKSISPSTSHMLLMWGSSDLFRRLDDFHRDHILDYKENIVFGSSFLSDVGKEIVSLLQNHKTIYSNKYISVARQHGGCYLNCIPLIGEQKIKEEGVPPHVFWKKLLDGRQAQWNYLSGGSSQRNKRRPHFPQPHYSEESLSDDQSVEAAKRRKKIDGTKIDSSSQQAEPRLEKPNSCNKECLEKSGFSLINNSESMSNNDHSLFKSMGPTLPVMTNGSDETPTIAGLGDVQHWHNEQMALFELLKPIQLDLCEALLFEDGEKILVEQFLEHLIKNYRVTKEPETTLQAFLLSVCWTAAEELKNRIDHKKSLFIARGKVGFNCSEREAEDLYRMLKPKLKKFLCLGIKNSDLEEILVESPLGNVKSSSVELEESSFGANFVKEFEKHMKKVEGKCGKKMEKLKNKHNEELEKFEKSWEELKMKLESWCKRESTTIRYTYANSSVGIDKLRVLDNDYAKKREDLEKQISIYRKDLEARQKNEKDEEQKMLAGYMKRLKSLWHRKLLEKSLAKNETNSLVAEPIGQGKDSNGTAGINGNLPKQSNFEGEATDSIIAENLENEDEQRVNCENDDSMTSKENIPASKEPDADMLHSEQACASTGQIDNDTNLMDNLVVDTCTFPTYQLCTEQIVKDTNQIDNVVVASTIMPDQPCAPTSMMEKDTNQMDDVVVDTSTFLPDQPCVPTGQVEKDTSQVDDVLVDTSMLQPDQPCTPTGQTHKDTNQVDDVVNTVMSLPDQHCASTGRIEKATIQTDNVMVDRSSTAESDQVNGASTTGPLVSPVGSVTEHPIAYMSQGLGEESHNRVEDHVERAAKTHYIFPSTETSPLNCSNHVPFELPRGTSTATEASFNDWVTHYNDQIGVALNGTLDTQPVGNHTSIVGSIIPRHQDHNSASALGDTVSQPSPQLGVNLFMNETNVPVARGVQVHVPNISWTPSNHVDPLHNELDRMRRVIGNCINEHEQKKLELKSECDKEIEDLVAQIRRKYDKKVDEAEASFLLKKKELETCQNKIMMHKMLAEAFRSKCADYKAATRMQQLGNPSSSPASQSHSTRPFSPAGQFVAASVVSGPSSAAPPVRSIRPSMTISSQARISHISPVVPMTGQQQQVRREARAPAPHIQPFRPASPSIASTSMPSGEVLRTQSPNLTSTSASQLPPQLSPAQLNPRGQAQQEESMGRGTPPSLSLSATQLLMDITRLHDTNLHQNSINAPSLPDDVRNSESCDISQFKETTNLQPSSSNLPAEDVVCLSDDD